MERLKMYFLDLRRQLQGQRQRGGREAMPPTFLRNKMKKQKQREKKKEFQGRNY